MGTTAHGLRYPDGLVGVPPDVPGDLKNLAEDVDGKYTLAVQGDGVTYWYDPDGNAHPFMSKWLPFSSGYQHVKPGFFGEFKYMAGRILVRLSGNVQENDQSSSPVVFSAPTNFEASGAVGQNVGGLDPIGHCTAVHAGVLYRFTIHKHGSNPTNNVELRYPVPNGKGATALVTGTDPFVWSNGDPIYLEYIYDYG